MSDDKEREKEKEGGRKRDKDKERERDNSTPLLLDEPFAHWIQRLFRDEERVEFLVVTKTFGRNRRSRGDVLKRHAFKEGKPLPEDLVKIANELVEDMQNEADMLRSTCSFVIEAMNPKRGGVVATRPYETVPQKHFVRAGGDDGDEEEDSRFPNGGDTYRKRMEILLQDQRFYAELMATTSGGHIELLVNQNKDLYGLVKELIGMWVVAAKEKNMAENNALDRELARKEKEVLLEAKRRGINLVAGLLPGFVDKMMGGLPSRKLGQGQVLGRTPESVAIENVMESLTDEEKFRVFGAWTEDGKRTEAGILTENQVRIVIGVLKEEIPPERVQALIEGADAIKPEQYFAINQATDMEKLLPLIDVLKKHKEILAARQVAAGQAS